MKYTESLKKNRDFRYVYNHGISYANKYLVMYTMKNGIERNRIGISVSKKVGNSVVRHRITRLIRESYRLNEENFITGLDIIVVARANKEYIGFHEIERGLIHLARIHKIDKRLDMNENS